MSTSRGIQKGGTGARERCEACGEYREAEWISTAIHRMSISAVPIYLLARYCNDSTACLSGVAAYLHTIREKVVAVVNR